MLALMPRYCCLDRWLRELKAMETSPDGRTKEEREGIRQTLLEVAGNVLNYCRAVVAHSGKITSIGLFLKHINQNMSRFGDFYAFFFSINFKI